MARSPHPERERPPEDGSVTAWLESAAEVGERDSVGEFTLSAEFAVRKLATGQLPRPEFWTLKLVQFAVTMEASCLRIRQSPEATEFVLEAPRVQLNLDHFREAFMVPESSKERALDHLVVALRAVAGQDRAWQVWVGEETLRWDGELSKPGPQRSDPTARGRAVIRVDFRAGQGRNFLRKLINSAGVARDEYMAVVQHAYVAPLPVIFDGRRLDHGECSPVVSQGGSLSWLGLGVAPAEESQESTGIGIPRGLLRRPWSLRDSFFDGGPYHTCGDLGQARTSSLVQIHFGYRSEGIPGIPGLTPHRTWSPLRCTSGVHWVFDGVVVFTTTLDVGDCDLGVQLLLPAEGLGTDLSGFGLRQTESNLELVGQRRMAAMANLRKCAEQTHQALSSAPARPYDIDAVYYGSFGTAVLTLGGLLNAGTLIFATACTVPALAASAAQRKRLVTYCEAELVKLVRYARVALGEEPSERPDDDSPS